MAWPICKDCSGTGADPRDPESACPDCGGYGRLIPNRWRDKDVEIDRARFYKACGLEV